jgi:predicted restriction endonuclease
MTDVTQIHEEKETLTVDVNIPGHNFTDWTQFVDDMTVNGMLLCKAHHIGKDEGMHALPFPIWVAQKYGKEGYQFSAVEIIHHQE